VSLNEVTELFHLQALNKKRFCKKYFLSNVKFVHIGVKAIANKIHVVRFLRNSQLVNKLPAFVGVFGSSSSLQDPCRVL
jgi:hypothetical protein